MKVFLFIWITLLICFPHGVPAQDGTINHGEIDVNYSRYRQTFEKEIEGIETPGENVNTANSFIYSPVPDWFFQSLKTSPSNIQIFGISDPGIDSSIARTQAVFRALYLASLMTGTSVSNLVDNYSEDTENKSSHVSGQYVDYFELNSQVPFDISDVTIVKEQFTEFGECIVMIKIPASSASKPVLSFKTVGMITEFGKNGVYECNSRIEFSGQSTKGDFRYICRSVNGLVDAESYYNNEALSLNTVKLKYKQPEPADMQNIQGSRADRGLWNACLTAVLKALTLELRMLPAQLKSTSDNYTGKTEILNREATGGNLTFRLDQVFLNDNKIWAVLDQFNFTQP
jgi:hypothetical protein